MDTAAWRKLLFLYERQRGIRIPAAGSNDNYVCVRFDVRKDNAGRQEKALDVGWCPSAARLPCLF